MHSRWSFFLALLVPLSCGYRDRSVCQTLIACLEPNGGDWAQLDVEREYGRAGACWEDPTRRCSAECYERLEAVPPDVDRAGLCEAVYTPDLLTPAVFHQRFVEAFCRRSAECRATCEIPIRLPDPTPGAPPGCAFDLEAAQDCLDDPFAWACDEASPGGVALPWSCPAACVADALPAE